MTKKIHCKNCKNNFQGNFCNLCGQSSDTFRLNLHYLWHDLKHGIFHVDSGFYYTIKELFYRPGHFIREYIEGKRIRRFKPLTSLVVTATLYALIIHLFNLNIFIENSYNQELINTLNSSGIEEWTSKHFSWLQLITMPIFAMISYVYFHKQKYNYIEHIVLSSYIISQKIIINLCLLPIKYYFGYYVYIVIEQSIDLILMIWIYTQFFKNISLLKNTLLAFFISISYLILISVITGIILTQFSINYKHT